MTEPAGVNFSEAVLTSFVTDLFGAAGVSDREASLVAASLVESNLCGHESHGVIRVSEYVDAIQTGALRAGVELRILSQTESAVIADAGFGFGQTQMHRLIDILDPMARRQGIACGALRNCGHVGRLGEWVQRLADRKLAGLMSVNDNGVLMCVAPPGGRDARISTNPIAIGVPTEQEPLVLDISTSVVANGKIRVARLAGRPCPDGWLLDAQGRPTTDPATRFADPPGTILPMGGYKGFGLGMLMDILAAGLSGGYCPPAPSGQVECNNVLLIVFDPLKFSGISHFLAQSQGLCDFVRSSRPVTEGDTIRLPNDRSQETFQSRRDHGIPLDQGTWNMLVRYAQQLKVPVPAAPQ